LSEPIDSSRSSLGDELRLLFENWGLELPADFNDETSLITSGLFDSLALFNLILWIEKKVGHSVDPTRIDLIKEWDSIGNITMYVLRARESTETLQASRSTTTARSAPNGGYRVLKYDQSFKHKIADFQTGLWSSDAGLNLRYLEWKYERNPYTDKPQIYLVFYGDVLVGMRGFYASLWETGIPPRQFPVLVADDLLVREGYRNRGLVKRVMQAAYEDLRNADANYLFNLSGGVLTVIGSLAMGWRSIGFLAPMRRRSFSGKAYGYVRQCLNRSHYVRRHARSHFLYKAIARYPFSRLDRADSRLMKKLKLTVEIDNRPRPRAMADLIARIGYDGRVRHVRDERYFEWRFRNPLREYRFLYIGGDVLDGYLVLSKAVGLAESSRVFISDVEFMNSSVQAVLLKAAAMAAGAFSELVIWSATANSEMRGQLRAVGFRPFIWDRAFLGLPCFLVRPIDDERLDEDWCLGQNQLLNLNNWDIRMLHSMTG
jgi:acyl carrier protein